MKDDAQEAASKPMADLSSSGNEKRVLYVEDNPANLRLVERLLKNMHGCEFTATDSPVIGLERLLSFKPDLVLLDINLPGMDGYEVLRKMRAREETKAIPVVAISANAMPRDLAKAKQAGFDGYIVKPIDVKEFYQVVDHYLAD